MTNEIHNEEQVPQTEALKELKKMSEMQKIATAKQLGNEIQKEFKISEDGTSINPHVDNLPISV